MTTTNIQEIKLFAHVNMANMFNDICLKNKWHELVSDLKEKFININDYIKTKKPPSQIEDEFIHAKNQIIKIEDFICYADRNKNQGYTTNTFASLSPFYQNLFESALAFLQTGAGHKETRSSMVDVAKNILMKAYPRFDYETIRYEFFRYHWLKKQNEKFVVHQSTNRFGRTNEKPIPSDDEINTFFNENKNRIYDDMMFQEEGFYNPLYDSEQSYFYLSYQKLLEIPAGEKEIASGEI